MEPTLNIENNDFEPLDRSVLIQAQIADGVLNRAKQLILLGERSTQDDFSANQEIRLYVKHWDLLQVRNDMLVRRYVDANLNTRYLQYVAP